MQIIIDLVGDDEDVVMDDSKETQCLEEERKQREVEAWRDWVQQHEQVLPQVVPFDLP